MSTDTAILADDHHTRADLQLLKRSARSQWPVDDGIKLRAVERTADMLESERTSDVIAAVNALIQMDRANIAADKAAAPTTQHNTQVNVYMPANSRESGQPAHNTPAIKEGNLPVSASNVAGTLLAPRNAVGQGSPVTCEIVQVTADSPAQGR